MDKALGSVMTFIRQAAVSEERYDYTRSRGNRPVLVRTNAVFLPIYSRSIGSTRQSQGLE